MTIDLSPRKYPGTTCPLPQPNPPLRPHQLSAPAWVYWPQTCPSRADDHCQQSQAMYRVSTSMYDFPGHRTSTGYGRTTMGSVIFRECSCRLFFTACKLAGMWCPILRRRRGSSWRRFAFLHPQADRGSPASLLILFTVNYTRGYFVFLPARIKGKNLWILQ